MTTDEDSGLTVYGEKKAGIIAVTSYKYHYALILPFSKKWTFTPNDGILLKGNSDLINVSLWSETFKDTPDQHK